MTIEEGKRVGISRFPNFHKTGSVLGMKKLYYRHDCLLVRCYENLCISVVATISIMCRQNLKSIIRQLSKFQTI